MPAKFLFRPAFEAGNSVPAYLVHFAAENCLFGVRGLARVLSCSAKELVVKPYRKIASMIWTAGDVSDGERTAFETSPQVYVGSGRCRTRFCTYCLAAGTGWVHPAEWDFPASFMCPAHRCMLIDRCQACDHPFDHLEMPLPATCRCGASVARMRSHDLPSWAPAINWVLACGDANRANRWDQEEQMVRTLRYLSEMSLNGGRPLRGEDSAFMTVADVTDAEVVLTNWPKNFSSLLPAAGWHDGAWERSRIRDRLSAHLFPEILEVLDGERSDSIEAPPLAVEVYFERTPTEEMTWFYPVIFSECAFPVRNDEKVQRWGKAAEDKAWLFSCVDADPTSASPPALLATPFVPYGRSLRLALLWLASMARKTGSRVIWLNTARRLLPEVGFPMGSGGASGSNTRFWQQVVALSRTHFESKIAIGNMVAPATFEGRVVEAFGTEGPSFGRGWVRVSDWFYNEALKNSIQVSAERIATLQGSSLALDAYLWLMRHDERRTAFEALDWDELYGDFSNDCADERKIKENLFEAFRRVSAACQGLSVSRSAAALHLVIQDDFG